MSDSRDLRKLEGREQDCEPGRSGATKRMANRWQPLLWVALLGLALPACQPSAEPDLATDSTADETSDTAEPVREPPSLLGEVSREQIEAAEPSWVEEQIEATPDPAAVASLAAVPPGAEVTVYLGTWCGDSRRELGRFWRASDEAGGDLPFAVRYLAVDRYDVRPPELESEVGLRWVPTFIVERDGVEVGRMVEVSPNGIEADLAALLNGDAEGVISAREDLGGEGGGSEDGGDDHAPTSDS